MSVCRRVSNRQNTNNLMKKTIVTLSSSDLETICNVYDEIRFDFSPNEVSQVLLGISGNQLRSFNVKGETKWFQVNYSELRRVIGNLLHNHAIGSKWSVDSLVGKLVDCLAANRVSGKVDVKPLVNQFFKDISETSPIVYEICMPIHGVSLEKGKSLNVGKYSFAHIDYVLNRKFTQILGLDSNVESGKIFNADCFVCMTVSACEAAKAQELALKEFKWIENAIRFSLPGKMYGVGITRYDSRWIERMVVAIKGETIAGLSSSVKGPIAKIKIEELLRSPVFMHMIEVLGRPDAQLNEIQKRLRRAVYLCGLSTQTIDLPVSFFLCISALEALFCKQENHYVNPSIAQQIIESFCFLLVEEDKRCQCFESMQKWYGIRSAVAHGSDKQVSENDVIRARTYLMTAVAMFLMDGKLSNLKTMDELRALVNDIKFGNSKGKGK